jgi:nucleotide-binding universal stress UspA family protein
MYTHVIVGLDGSERAEAIFPHVVAIAKQFGAKVTLVQATPSLAETIVETNNPDQGLLVDPQPIMADERAAAEEYLAGAGARLRDQGLTVETQVVTGNAADALVDHATVLGADLIAAVTHGRTGLNELLHGGSTAEAILHRAPCPVLIVRAP